MSVNIKRQGCQRLEGKRILKGCMSFKSGTGLVKGKGNGGTRLQRKHLQKVKLRRQVLLCAIAKQLKKKTCCYMGFFSCLLIKKDRSSSLYRIFTKSQDGKWRALITNGVFGLEN